LVPYHKTVRNIAAIQYKIKIIFLQKEAYRGIHIGITVIELTVRYTLAIQYKNKIKICAETRIVGNLY
jgi:hypothetical protein